MKLLIAVLALALAGCATPALDPNYAKQLETQERIAALPKKQEPLLRIVALPGAEIRMSGLQEFTVYAPDAGGNQPPVAVPSYQKPHSDFVEGLQAVAGMVTPIGVIVAGGRAASGLATAVGASNVAIAGKIQAPVVPQANVTTTTTNTLSGSGVQGSGQMVGGNGTAGSGNTVPTTTTTSTDSHNAVTTTTTTTTDNHSTTTPGKVCTADPKTGVITCQ